MVWKKASICLSIIALLVVPVVQAAHHEGEFEALAEAWEAAYNQGDAAAVAAMYAQDGMRMPPDVPIVKGRAAIEAQIRTGMEQGLAKVKIEVVDFHVAGEMAHGRGTFEGMDADGNTMTKGKWVNVAKYVDGKWQVQFDIFNYDAPMAAPQ